MDYPISREEAREDAAGMRRALARLGRREAALLVQLAEVRATIEGRRMVLRMIAKVYPDLVEEEPPRKPLADLFGSDPDFTGGMDSVAYVRQGRGEV